MGPTDMNVHEHAQEITKKCNSSLATSGRCVHTCTCTCTCVRMYVYSMYMCTYMCSTKSKLSLQPRIIFISFINSEVKDPGLLNLIAQLTGLLLQVEVSKLGRPCLCQSHSITAVSWYIHSFITCTCKYPQHRYSVNIINIVTILFRVSLRVVILLTSPP